MRPPPLAYDPPVAPWLRVLRADTDLLVLSKPAGLLTVPGRDPALADCLEARARAVWPAARMVHRLDLATSGLVLAALSPRSLRLLGLQFERRMVEKLYLAEVAAPPPARRGRIDAPLACDWPNRPRQRIDSSGRAAATIWRLLGRGPIGWRLALRPLTGRSHQLRVHLAALGVPILGDRLYGGAAAEAAPRLRLHAARLTFRHPADGRRIVARDRALF